ALPAWLIEAAFVAFLLLVFVGLTPFAMRVDNDSGMPSATGSGDLMRQVCYLAVFALLVAASVQKRGLMVFAVVPVSLLLLLAWCFASAAWAPVPGVVIRRAGLEFVIVCSALLGVDTLGSKRSLELLRYVLIGVLIVNWISIPVIPQAKHLADETDPSLVGDWRGLYFQKNIAGSVCVVTVMILLFFASERKSQLDLLLAAAALGFLVMTRSKTSLGFLPVVIFLGLVYRWAWKRELDRLIVTICAAIVLIAVAAFVATHAAQLSRMLENPAEFTGRSEIWQAELRYIAAHPWLGAGYGTFSDTGGASPLSNYVMSKWVENAPHGHNGYLQLLVTTGAIGFALAMLALVILPLLTLYRRDPDNLELKALLFAIFCFVVLHNFLESDYLESDGVMWTTLLLTIAMLRGLRPPAVAERRA
ncbi:MAG: O-antigen ligase family protein, partial [Alphaproteobacteria bacterium]|nr:O-antigen ligase family protein [Alphaproteobacteria bacterium]